MSEVFDMRWIFAQEDEIGVDDPFDGQEVGESEAERWESESETDEEPSDIEQPMEPQPAYPEGTRAFSTDVNDDLLCPSQVYEYVEVVDGNRVLYVGYDERDSYEDELTDDEMEKMFGPAPEQDVPEDETEPEFDEIRASRAFM